ncbi:MAG: carbohydrate binding family 9 domain-containing protein [Flavobacteriales bacterium]|nr:carbohydrate binding family 9 domain-containing protein [Flavobacteriales bacterium]MCX7649358.1 carbohydrate binding family 9 domain-containing protein [Flavobacteriales bacterium]MDW8432769.1 DUF5916 domain-containing protein [Flavobacteriales bacterium]
MVNIGQMYRAYLRWLPGFSIGFWTAGWTTLVAQGPTEKSYRIQKITGSCELDGLALETFWQSTEVASGFHQKFPSDSLPFSQPTEVRLAYDQKNIYLHARCGETVRKPYVVQSLKRDFDMWNSDCFVVYFDTYNDKTNAFCFVVNPYNAQAEIFLQNGGGFGGLEPRWDNRWFSAVHRDSLGWQAEIKIPFKTLRYKAGNTLWRVNFVRVCLNINEEGCWSPIPVNFGRTSLAFSGRLEWPEPPPPPRFNAALIPYALGGLQTSFTGQPTRYQPLWGLGADAKISLTPSLNLDLTANPDFSQVDVDRQITNLTRFSLFFPEQRQFFIENSDLFARFGFTRIRPFFSRQIGLYNGQAVPILGGVRLSGKVNRRWRVGAMDIQTAGRGDLNLRPQNYLVAAVQRLVFNRSNIGFIFVNRQAFEGPRLLKSDYNRIVGLDYDLASRDNVWTGKFFFHHSLQPGTLRDAYAHASYLGYNTRHWSIMWNHEYVGRSYTADVGFVPRQFHLDSKNNRLVRLAYWRLEPSVAYIFYPENSRIFSISPQLYFNWYADSSFSPTDAQITPSLTITFLNTAVFSAGFNENFTRLLFDADITGKLPLPLPRGGYHYRTGFVKFESNKRKLFTYNLNIYGGSYFNGHILGLGGQMGYRVQPWGNFSLRFTYDDVMLPAPYGRKPLTLVGPTLEITPRNNIFFTTFIQYNTQISNLNVTARLQWRFAPMSDVFLVYTDNYGTEKWDIRSRGVVLKVVYWLGL